jgi:energy-coupling factor transport system permease protein
MYRRRASPLHACRAGVAAVWCIVPPTVALAFEHPLLLVALLASALAAAAAAGVGRPVARVVVLALPLALVIAAINPLVSHNGLTVLVRGWELGPLGRMDITLEALAYGAVLGLCALVVAAWAALLATAVDPDELLRAVRRVSFRFGVTAALATRLLPVLARDARRMADARRCLGPVRPADRAAVLRAVTAGALDRATDVAATLEVRGFGIAGRPPRRVRPASRHDLAFAASAFAVTACAVAAGLAGFDPFAAYPRVHAPIEATLLLLTAVLPACLLLPFADRRGIEP